MKGVSAVVATILILLITVALAASAYVWFTTVFQQTTNTGSQQINQANQQISTQFAIASINKFDVYIQNTGSVDITPSTLAFFVDNIKTDINATTMPTTLAVGLTQKFVMVNTTGDASGKIKCGSTLKVTAGGGLSQTATITC